MFYFIDEGKESTEFLLHKNFSLAQFSWIMKFEIRDRFWKQFYEFCKPKKRKSKKVSAEGSVTVFPGKPTSHKLLKFPSILFYFFDLKMPPSNIKDTNLKKSSFPACTFRNIFYWFEFDFACIFLKCIIFFGLQFLKNWEMVN